ncbi:MAG: ABC transporter permease [Hydrogenophaga sp.]|uniref:ABC transporter permease n=1 Tax=Hydrogenophaga sp. TaxID=1904254 RepID=UPI001D9856CD|nr:ABC transporter permease [Hydrogenophaga sp.]MBW0169448.1 ABC transporter permease [Hydrogenophaga sp.]MBW0183121.1 ABC transporter permease [Hydrogenophaga sp.]
MNPSQAKPWPVWRALNPSGRIGLLFLVAAVVLCTVVAWTLQQSPSTMSESLREPPSATHWLGTDDLGRDVLARVAHGGQISLMVGAFSASIAVLIGVAVGAACGYVGGAFDAVVMRITEAFQIIPRFFLALIVVALVGSGIWKIILVLGLLSWPATARVVRAQVLVLRKEEFVLAAIMGGASTLRVIGRHILPNVAPIIAVSASLQAGSAILLESFISFLGLGDVAHPSWGLLLQQGQLFIRDGWWISTFPGLALSLTILGLNLLGDGIRAAHGDTASTS